MEEVDRLIVTMPPASMYGQQLFGHNLNSHEAQVHAKMFNHDVRTGGNAVQVAWPIAVASVLLSGWDLGGVLYVLEIERATH